MIGKDLSMIGVVTRKHDLLRSEIYSHKTEIEEIKRRAQLLIYEGQICSVTSNFILI